MATFGFRSVATLSALRASSCSPSNRTTGRTFTPTRAQVGKRMTVRVTGRKAGYTTLSKTSAATARVAR